MTTIDTKRDARGVFVPTDRPSPRYFIGIEGGRAVEVDAAAFDRYMHKGEHLIDPATRYCLRCLRTERAIAAKPPGRCVTSPAGDATAPAPETAAARRDRD